MKLNIPSLALLAMMTGQVAAVSIRLYHRPERCTHRLVVALSLVRVRRQRLQSYLHGGWLLLPAYYSYRIHIAHCSFHYYH
jgi:hypothetical protein